MRHFVFILTVFSFLLCACEESSPLFGTWADNRGNTFSFFSDGTFNARIQSAGVSKNYEGNYSILFNSMTLDCTNEDLRVVTEWDIRGNMLYLDWTNEEGIVFAITLYKVSD